MLVDVHTHLDYFSDEKIESIIENAKKEGVGRIVTNSVDFESCKKSLEISKKYKIVKLAAGLYPNDKLTIKDFEKFEKFVLENRKKINAIGEIGMDFMEGKNKEAQELIFRKQLELAQRLDLPVFIHTRKAEKEIVEILEEFPKVKKILHCFMGKFKLIEKANEIGCFFSIPTSIVRSEHFQKMVKELPREKILTETDAPFQSPFREKENESAFIVESIKMISLIWKIPVEEVEKIIEKNYRSLF